MTDRQTDTQAQDLEEQELPAEDGEGIVQNPLSNMGSMIGHCLAFLDMPQSTFDDIVENPYSPLQESLSDVVRRTSSHRPYSRQAVRDNLFDYMASYGVAAVMEGQRLDRMSGKKRGLQIKESRPIESWYKKLDVIAKLCPEIVIPILDKLIKNLDPDTLDTDVDDYHKERQHFSMIRSEYEMADLLAVLSRSDSGMEEYCRTRGVTEEELEERFLAEMSRYVAQIQDRVRESESDEESFFYSQWANREIGKALSINPVLAAESIRRRLNPLSPAYPESRQEMLAVCKQALETSQILQRKGYNYDAANLAAALANTAGTKPGDKNGQIVREYFTGLMKQWHSVVEAQPDQRLREKAEAVLHEFETRQNVAPLCAPQ